MSTYITRRLGVSLAESGAFVAPVVAGELVAIAGTYDVLFAFAIGLGVTGALSVGGMAESGGPSDSAGPSTHVRRR